MLGIKVFKYLVIVTNTILVFSFLEEEANKEIMNPLAMFEDQLYENMFGNKTRIDRHEKNTTNELVKYPTGRHMRKEFFKGKIAVHAPFPDIMLLKGSNKLNVTTDYMQTAVDAFAIIIYGNLDDILNLPPKYVLLSARTISMMKVAREKLSATWTVVKGYRSSSKISATVLELYRPLFKYLSGKEMAKLNLTDEKILYFIGTHEELTRHQVGVVASAYIKQNPNWHDSYYLNTMNNLICGLPISFMRKIPRNTYLQLSPELFYHIRSCDDLQRKFLLAMVSQTQILGKPFSWTIHEVSRLGLILAAVDGPDLASINPDAFVGLTAQVLKEMNPIQLQYMNQLQIDKLNKKAYNVLAKKMQNFKNQLATSSTETNQNVMIFYLFVAILLSTNRL